MTQIKLEATPEQKAVRDPLLRMTPNQAAQWIEANVNNLATAKDVLKRLAKVCIILARRERNET